MSKGARRETRVLGFGLGEIISFPLNIVFGYLVFWDAPG